MLNMKLLKAAMESTDKIITPPLMEWLPTKGDNALSPEVAAIILRLLTTQPRYRGAGFSASSAGKCERAQVYGFLDLLQSLPDHQLANIFMDGKYRHLRWQAMLLSVGVIDEVEWPLKWPNMQTLGTVDGYGVVSETHPRNVWRGQEFGFELKGVSTFQYQRYMTEGPKDDHLNQVACYFLLSGWPLFSIVYEDKTTQAWFEWVVEASDPDIQRRMKEQTQERIRLNEAVKTKTIPPRLPECQQMKGPTWKGCPYGKTKTGPCATVSLWPARRPSKPTKR